MSFQNLLRAKKICKQSSSREASWRFLSHSHFWVGDWLARGDFIMNTPYRMDYNNVLITVNKLFPGEYDIRLPVGLRRISVCPRVISYKHPCEGYGLYFWKKLIRKFYVFFFVTSQHGFATPVLRKEFRMIRMTLFEYCRRCRNGWHDSCAVDSSNLECSTT